MYKRLRGFLKLPWRQLWLVLKVFWWGAQKHQDDLWFEAGYEAWHFALKARKHEEEWGLEGKWVDPETGQSPLIHAVCDLLMAAAIEDRSNRE